MAKELNGRELADFIKERQARQVRNLRQAHGVVPRLCIIQSNDVSPVIDTYVRMKRMYAEDILVAVDIVRCQAVEMSAEIARANEDSTIHGIIVQLPIDDLALTDEIVAKIAPAKDVDGLGPDSQFISATAEAIDWLVTGYNIALESKRIVLIGRGRLIGRPLERLWRSRGFDVQSMDKSNFDPAEVRRADIVVTATGAARSLESSYIKQGAIVIDAGTASEDGAVIGDVAPLLRERTDVMMTPEKGGVGPLTVAVMFDHVIQAALKRVGKL